MWIDGMEWQGEWAVPDSCSWTLLAVIGIGSIGNVISTLISSVRRVDSVMQVHTPVRRCAGVVPGPVKRLVVVKDGGSAVLVDVMAGPRWTWF